MSKVITVIAVQTDTQKAVFIDNEGNRHTVQQTDPALRKLIADLMPLIIADQREANRTGKPQKGVRVDLNTFSMYGEFEAKTNGLVRFFRAAKEKVKSIIEVFVPEDSTPEEDTIAYQKKLEEAWPKTAPVAPPVPTEAQMDTETEKALETALSQPVVEPTKAPEPKSRARYEDMKDHLRPITSDENLPPDETLVAVVNGVVIPGIEALKPYIAHALKNNSVKSVIAFLERIARNIDTKGHTIPDLMQFIEKGDLPLAEDGCIIAYKILKRTTDHGKYTYVDCHSRKVHQRVGTYVRVPEKMVDPNRRIDCSHGLHVARRGYLGGFSGDVCTIIKMPPEDVVAVPQYDANKVRTCGYYIIGELSKHVYDVLRSGQGMTNDPEAAALLHKAITGDHIGILEEVWVNGHKGTNLEVKNELDKSSADKAIKEDKAKAVTTDKRSTNVDEVTAGLKDEPIDPRKLNEQIKAEQAKQETSGKTPLQVRYDEALAGKIAVAVEILDQKKRAKKSWAKLGLPDDAGDKLQAVVDASKEKPKDEIRNAIASHVTADKDDPIVARNAKAEPKKKATSVKGPKNPARINTAVVTLASKNAASKLNVGEQAQEFFIENKWAELWALKKAKKKGWEALGFSSLEIAEIEKHKP